MGCRSSKNHEPEDADPPNPKQEKFLKIEVMMNHLTRELFMVNLEVLRANANLKKINATYPNDIDKWQKPLEEYMDYKKKKANLLRKIKKIKKARSSVSTAETTI